MHPPFNVKSSMSFFRSSILVEDMIEKAKSLNFKYLFLNDYANTFNAIKFYSECKKNGIKPILGAELFLVYDAKDSRKKTDKKVDNIILVAKNNIGWQNLNRLISISNSEEYFYFRPRIDFELLQKYKDGLVLFTGDSYDGIIAKYLHEIRDDNDDVVVPRAKFRARSLLRQLVGIFGKDNIIVEIHDEGLSFQDELATDLAQLAKDFELKTLKTKCARYIEADRAKSHKILTELSANRVKPDSMPYDKPIFAFDSVQSPELDDIAAEFNVEIDLSQNRLPKYQYIPSGETSASFLRKLAFKGLKTSNTEYVDRLNRELSDVDEMGFNDYFLIVADVCGWARKNKIMIGHGRGSAAGSLLSYSLGITRIDPIKYKLIWERFLNKGRKGLPDIDLDFPRSKRQQIIGYIEERFGKNNVAQIVTFNALKARSALKDLFKFFNIPFSESNKICSYIPLKNDDHTEVSLSDAYRVSPELVEYKKQYPEIFKTAEEIEGCHKSIGIHAAGVLISDSDFESSSYPLCRSADGDSLIFGYDMGDIENLKLLKLDVLGLNTLDDIEVACKMSKIDPLNIPLNNSKTFDILQSGDTTGIFQLESNLGKTWARKLSPKSIEDISNIIALIRPGCLSSGETDKYYNRITGKELAVPPHKSLTEILRDTAGILVYQEQAIFAAKILTGWNLGDCDSLRRVIGKKKREELVIYKDRFRNDALKNGYQQDVIDTVWGVIDASASYSFNLSHSIGYSMLSYETAYLKANYPVQFYCAKLRNAEFLSDAIDEISNLILDASAYGVKIAPPSLKYLNQDFEILDNKTIAFGLSSIKNVGKKDIDHLSPIANLSGEKFLIEAAKTSVNFRAFGALAKVGALDYIGIDRNQIISLFEILRELSEKEISSLENSIILGIKKFAEGKINARRKKTLDGLIDRLSTNFKFSSVSQKIDWEKELIGIPVTLYLSGFFERSRTKCAIIKSSFDDNGFRFNSNVYIENIKEITTKRGDKMAFLTCFDNTASLDNFVLFPQGYTKYLPLISNTKVVTIAGKIDNRGSAIIDSIYGAKI